MIKSMTGYGQGIYEKDGRKYTVEVKSINHRYSDITIRLPRYLSALEEDVRKYVASNMSRGKIEVIVSLKNMSNVGRNIKVDEYVAGAYINGLREIVNKYNIPDDITASTLARIPDIFVVEDEDLKELYLTELRNALETAILNVNNSRVEEGRKLADDIAKRLDKILADVLIVEEKSSSLLTEYKAKLESRIKELSANNIVDENRLALEIVLFADKSSICEEVTRLKSHISSFKGMLNATGPIGKKIDFLIQEMNRETNTIGSKANSIGITEYVIEMKNEIENIREQIQNIE